MICLALVNIAHGGRIPGLHLAPVDWAIVLIYGLVVVTIGLRASRRASTSEGYFLANRQLRWPVIGASLFASNISAEHFVGLAGSGFAIGMAIGWFEWMAVFCLAPLILLFLPFYVRNRIYTVPEFLEKRFSARVRLLFSALMIVLSVLTKISISLWASSIVFSELLGWDKLTVIWVVGLFTALYTMKGGLSAVVYTDALQTSVLLAAAVVLTIIGLGRVGGWSGLRAALPPEMFSMVKPATHPDVPWPGMFIGVFLVGSFYWSMDQVLVQRVFAARDLNEGRLGAVFCGYLKITTPFLLVLPGLIARVLFPTLQSPDQAYPALLAKLMPAGLLGLTVAGIAAALMGHLSATYNSIATLFTRDFYLRWRPGASQKSQVFTGRIAVLAVFVVGALWAPVIGQFNSLWIYLQSVGAYLMMPFVGVFYLGVLWKRVTTQGVMAAVAAGFIAGPLLMYDGRHPFLPLMQAPVMRPWLHGAIVEFVICVTALIGVSLLTKAKPAASLESTTVDWNRGPASAAQASAERASVFGDYRLWLAVLVSVTAGLWWLMR
jgi:SSS family solute:Na+ symporter